MGPARETTPGGECSAGARKLIRVAPRLGEPVPRPVAALEPSRWRASLPDQPGAAVSSSAPAYGAAGRPARELRQAFEAARSACTEPKGAGRLRRLLAELPTALPASLRGADLLLRLVDPDGVLPGSSVAGFGAEVAGSAESREFRALVAEVWNWAFGGGRGVEGGPGLTGFGAEEPVPEAQLREAVLETGMKAALGCTDWAAQSPTVRLALCEERLLMRMGTDDFRALNRQRQSFLSWLRGREEVTKALFRAEGPEQREEASASAAGPAKEAKEEPPALLWLEAEAAQLLRQVREFSSAEVSADELARILAAQWRLGTAKDFEPLAAALVKGHGSPAWGPCSGSWGGGSLLSAGAALWQPSGSHRPCCSWGLADTLGETELLGRRALKAAPALEELGTWLRWEEAFAPALGELRGFLRRAAPSVGALIFDVGAGEFVKVTAAAAAKGRWEVALSSRSARQAAEALLAAIHTCGVRGLPGSFWRCYVEELVALAEAGGTEDRATAAAFVTGLLAALPAAFRQHGLLLTRMLQPLAPSLSAELLEASGGGAACGSRKALHTAGLLLGIDSWVSALREHLHGHGADEAAQAWPLEDAGQGDLQHHHVEAPGAPPAPPMPRLIWVADDDEGGDLAPWPVKREEEEHEPTGAVLSTQRMSQDGLAMDFAEGVAAHEVAALLRAQAKDEHDVFPGGEEAARALVEHIRKEEFGVDDSAPAELSGLRKRQNSRLARALARLGEQLYADSCHWQLELLQNADDCEYALGIEPQIEFHVSRNEVVVRSNERGLSPEDVCAICDIGSSTKVSRRSSGSAAIGEKGLGFKAVYAISDTPRLFSGPVAIGFDARHPSGLGYVLPEWLGSHYWSASGTGSQVGGGSAGWTTALLLPLRDALASRSAEIAARLAELPAATLLFLRRVRCVSVMQSGGGAAERSRVRFSVEQLDGHVVAEAGEEAVVRVEAEAEERHERWLLVRHQVPVPSGVVRPSGATPAVTELVAALPLAASGSLDLARGPQPIFAHLPVGAPAGLTVALQADWALASSREALLDGHPWNEMLLSAVPALLLKVVDACRVRGGKLAQGYLAAVPDPAAILPALRVPMVRLGRGLRSRPCILTAREEWVVPSKALLVGRQDIRGLLESPESPFSASAPPDMHLIHDGVEHSVPAALLESLGCQSFGARHVLQMLEAWAPTAGREAGRSAAWWQQLLAALDDLLDSCCPAEAAALLPPLRRLAFLPLVGGGGAACVDGLCLPPEGGLAVALPQALLVAMRVVWPALVEARFVDVTTDSEVEAEDGAGGWEKGPGSSGDLLAARAKRVLRRLGVIPLTLNRIFGDLVLPIFTKAASAARASRTALPTVVAAQEVGQPQEILEAVVAVLVAHWDELKAELGDGSCVAWPLLAASSASGASLAVGVPRRAPPLHLPSLQLDAVLGGSPCPQLLPYLPPPPLKDEAMRILRRSGLALPVLRVQACEGDWACPEFDRLVYSAGMEALDGRPVPREEPRFRALALAFDEHWASYDEFTRGAGATGGASGSTTFLLALRSQSWMPSSDGAMHPPSELCMRTAAIMAAFPESAASDLLSCTVPLRNRSFCNALGIQLDPSAGLAVALLRSWSRWRSAGTSPSGAAGAYALVEAESSEAALLTFPSVVVGRGEPLLSPADCVWEDAADCGGAPVALAPLYGPRWRRFFVENLGVRKEPDLESCTRALDRMAAGVRSSKQEESARGPPAAVAALHRLLLYAGGGAARGAWASEELGGMLHTRSVFPLVTGSLGAPCEGLLWLDDCPDAPPAWLKTAVAEALVEEPEKLNETGRSAAWRLLLDSVGVLAVSAACAFRAAYVGASGSKELTGRARSLLALAERYLRSRHPALHTDLASGAPRLGELRVLRCLEVTVECRLVGEQPTVWPRDVAFRDDPDSSGPALLVTTSSEVPWPSLCLALARAVVPPGPEPRSSAREGLATFLLSAHTLVSGGDGNVSKEAAQLAQLCEAFQLAPVPPSEAWDLSATGEGAVAQKARQLARTAGGGGDASTLKMKSEAAKPEDEGGLPAFLDPYGGTANDPSRVVKMETDAPAQARGAWPRFGRAAGARTSPGAPGALQSADLAPGLAWPRKRPRPQDESEEEYGTTGGPGRSGGGGRPRGPWAGGGRDDAASWESPVFAASVADLSSVDLGDVREARLPLPEVRGGGTSSDEDLQAVGRWGERFVHGYLRQVLGRTSGSRAADRVVWVNSASESGYPYDIRVDDEEGRSIAFVEVKATRSSGRHIFEISHEEWAFARRMGAKYAIYRVLDAGRSTVRLAIVADPHRQWSEHKIGFCLSI